MLYNQDTASDKSDRSEKPRSSTSQSGSSTIFCQTCGRNFGARTIKIHEPQCLKRWQAANNISSPDNKKKQDKSSGFNNSRVFVFIYKKKNNK